MKRKPLLMLLSGILLVSGSLAFVSCDPDENENTLSVSPNDALTFQASGNDDVVLTITTNADSWDFKKPEWMTGSKDGNKLTLNVTDNTTGKQQLGRVEVTADKAPSVYINVTQSATGGSSGAEANGSLQDGDNLKSVFLEMSTEDVSGILYFSIDKIMAADVNAEISFDGEYLKEYNQINKTECVLFPESLVTIANQGKIVVKKGSKTSDDLTVEFECDTEKLEYNVNYLVPLLAESKSTDLKISDSKSRVNYVIKRKSPKEVKNYLYFEVNDTNPLNALEWVIEDGQPFFDVVCYFASNTNYNSTEDVVYLHHNTNCTQIYKNPELYVAPLRKAGIKVHLGLLGNHDAAGICQLSDWGAQQYAITLATAVDEYGLDGINFDDEYSGSPITSNKWFASKSAARGSRLMYECKKAMTEMCGPGQNEIAIFQYGGLSSPPATTDLDSGDAVDQSKFIDINTANYGSRGWTLGSQTTKNLSYKSVELRRGGSASEADGKGALDSGYGWFMWFALQPENYSSAYNHINNASKGMYGKGVIKPAYYYKKVQDVSIDPNRYPYSF